MKKVIEIIIIHSKGFSQVLQFIIYLNINGSINMHTRHI